MTNICSVLTVLQVLDQDGVGELIKFAVERGRATRPDIKIGLCGEQGGEPKTVGFLHEVRREGVGGPGMG